MLDLAQLAEIHALHAEALKARVKEFDIQGRFLAFNSEPAIMGVVNLSADSWYRESVCLTAESAIRRGRTLHAQGAAIVDLGAESTLATAARMDGTGQNSKLLPVLEALNASGVPVSIETYDLGVAQTCLKAGAAVLNLTGTTNTEAMFRLAVEHNAAVILCYVEGDNVREVGEFNLNRDPVEAMYGYFARQIELAGQCGLQRLFIDPGMGFYYKNLQDSGARVRYQMKTFLNTVRFRKLGFPVCHALPHAFEFFGEEVRSAESFFCMLAALGKTDLFRTHEVPRIKAVLDTMRQY